ncbi:MAG: hypothetical protein IKN91_03270 [Paludibacteraceae bacterium]|nr:hypothetical protein [Paludibacteraceae bacterium]
MFECDYYDNGERGYGAEYCPNHPCRRLCLSALRAVGLGLCLPAGDSLSLADGVRGGRTIVADGGLNVVVLFSASRRAACCSSDRILSAKRVRSRPIGNAGFLRGGFVVRGVVGLREVDSPAVDTVGFCP